MSGFRGTFGSQHGDAVIKWLYSYLEDMNAKEAKRAIKFIQLMIQDRNDLLKIQNKKFRNRIAASLRREHERMAHSFGLGDTWPVTALESRLLNLCARYYREVVRGPKKKKEKT